VRGYRREWFTLTVYAMCGNFELFSLCSIVEVQYEYQYRIEYPSIQY